MAQSNADSGESAATTPLQPMRFTDLLDAAFSLYRNHFGLFLGISAVYCLPHIVFSAFPIWMELLCDMFVEIICCGGLVYASAEAYLGRRLTVRAAFSRVIDRIWPYLGSTFLYGLAIVAVYGLFLIGAELSTTNRILLNDEIEYLIIVPIAVCFMARWGFYDRAVLVEETSARDALRRSSELVKGGWWRVFGVMFGIMLLSNIIELVLQISSALIFALSRIAGEVDLMEMREVLWHNHRVEGVYHVWHAMTTAIETLTKPIAYIGFTLLYFDRRFRKEGFDIEMMVQNKEVGQF